MHISLELRTRMKDELAQGTLEYVIVLGAVVVACGAALTSATHLILPQVLPLVCPAIDPMGPAACLIFGS